jgi:ubiquinone/menaquinone biosynthesis C-methylase UbiE
VTVWKEKRKVAQQYNASSEMYEGLYSEEQQAKYLRALQNVNLKKSVSLDVGCGSGLFFKEIAKQSEMVIGIDISINLLKKANAQAKKSGNVHVILADADHLPLKEHPFDLVFSFTILQNMPSPKETLIEIKHVTKSGGKIVVSGLKKAFTFTAFLDLFDATDLRLVNVIDDDTLKCYIAVAALG